MIWTIAVIWTVRLLRVNEVNVVQATCELVPNLLDEMKISTYHQSAFPSKRSIAMEFRQLCHAIANSAKRNEDLNGPSACFSLQASIAVVVQIALLSSHRLTEPPASGILVRLLLVVFTHA